MIPRSEMIPAMLDLIFGDDDSANPFVAHAVEGFDDGSIRRDGPNLAALALEDRLDDHRIIILSQRAQFAC